MYIIEDGKAYQINGEVAYQVKFDGEGKMTVDKEKEIDAKDKQKYSYDEMYRKLNIEYAIEMYNNQKREDKRIQTLNSKIEELTKENQELKLKIKELTEEKSPKAKKK